MYPVTQDYQDKIKENNRLFKAAIQIQHSTGVLNLSDKDLVVGSLTYTESSQAGEEFTIGSTVASDISFTMLNKPEYENINFMGATVTSNIGLLVKEGADTHFLQPTQPSKFLQTDDLWGEVPLGKFNIDDHLRLRNTIQIKAVDDMLNLDKPYSLSQLSYPANLYQIYVNICNFGDIQIGTFDFPNKNYIVQERPDGELTFRDVLGYVAELSGTFAKCNRNGALELKWYEPSGITLEPSNRFNFIASDDVVQIKGIMATVDDTTYLTGSEDYAIDLTDNPLLQGDYETVLPNIFNNVKDTIFTPYTSDWQGNMAIEAGDMITQIDRDGKEYNTLITRSMYKYRGRSNLKAKGLPEISKGYKGSTNKRIAQIRRIVEKEVGDKLTTLEQAQLNATELMTNMLGGHIIEDKENGILYIADNPNLELATKIWKWGTGGFGYSEDGGVTWGTAITADGSIVASLISAGLITAEMVQTGLLSSEDGSTWINLDDGTFNLKNKIKFVDNKFTIELSNDDIKDIVPYTVIFSNENQTFVTNNNGTVPAITIVSSNIDVYRGATKVNATIGTPVLRNLSDQPVSGGNITKANPTITSSGNVVWTIPNGVNVSSDSGYIHIPITVDGTTYNKKLTWSKAKSGKDGTDGRTPVKGTDYFDGIDGQDGSSNYIWVKYSANANGSNFGDAISTYMGVATTTSATAPTLASAYKWSKVIGTDGVAGETGTNGQTSYLHIKYSNNGTSFTANSGETVGDWIGTYVDFIEADSMTFSKYAWNKVKGTDGTNGTNAKLVDIVPSNVYFTKKRSGVNYIVNPNNITLTPNFQNCVYSKWEYSINGTDWTAITRTTVSTTLPYMNSSSRILTIPKAWSIITNNDYVVFKITSTTGESDVQTISILYDVGELETRVSSAEQKITPTAITNTVKQAISDGIIDVVTTSEVTQTMDSWVAKFDYLKSPMPPFRYVRSSQRGIASTIDGLAGWYELEVIDENNVNVALGKTVTSNKTPIDGTLSRYTDGGKAGLSYFTFGAVPVGQYTWVKVDLGKNYSNIDRIIDYCAFALIYSYQYKLEVSEDNINWFTLFDGIKSGENIHTFNTKGGFQQGITTINADGIRVEHTDFEGQYSEMRADGFVRKWQYGDAKYLNDIFFAQYTVSNGGASDIAPPITRIKLPLSFRGRGGTTEIYTSMTRLTAIINPSSTEEASVMSTLYQNAYVAGHDFNVAEPYIDIDAKCYTNLRKVAPGTVGSSVRYYSMTFIVMIIGR